MNNFETKKPENKEAADSIVGRRPAQIEKAIRNNIDISRLADGSEVAYLVNGQQINLKETLGNDAGSKLRMLKEDLFARTNRSKKGLIEEDGAAIKVAQGADLALNAATGGAGEAVIETAVESELERDIADKADRSDLIIGEEKIEAEIYEILQRIILESTAAAVYEVDEKGKIDGINLPENGMAFVVTKTNYEEIRTCLKHDQISEDVIKNNCPGEYEADFGSTFTFKVGGEELKFTFLVAKEVGWSHRQIGETGTRDSQLDQTHSDDVA